MTTYDLRPTTYKPFVLWLTGLSGSGKTKLAEKLLQYFILKGLKVENLDGDVLRAMFGNTGFSKEERDAHIKRAGQLAKIAEAKNIIVVASFISPYRLIRDEVRSECDNFIEVYVNCPIDVCEKRDPKGLYKKVRSGQIKNFTGIDDPYEPPLNPEITLHTDKETEDESCNKIIEYLKDNGLIGCSRTVKRND